MEDDGISTPNSNRKENLNRNSSGAHFFCEFCSIKFAFKSSLKKHLKRKHEATLCQPELGSSSNGRGSGRFLCKLCHTKFAFKSSLNKHLKRKHETILCQPRPGSRGNGRGSGRFLCELCHTKFAFKSSLNKHLKRKHEVTLPGSSNIQSFGCKYCSQKYVHNASLHRHMKQKHPTHQLNSKLQARSLLSKPFICSYCKHSYTSKTALKKHIRIKHGIPPTDNIASPKANVYFCNICQFSGSSFDILVSHYKDQHEIHIKRENYIFDSYNTFLIWKEEEEKRCKNRYVKKYGARVRVKGGKTIIYHCHRSGFYKSKNTGKRRLKIQGSRKIGTYCPSRMFVKIKVNGNVLLKYVVTHVGHDSDLCHLNLSVTERKILANEIALKPFESVLDEVRNSACNEKEISRLHRITRLDLRNIKKCFNLTSRHKNDATSVDLGSRESEYSINLKHQEPVIETDNNHLESIVCNETSRESEVLLNSLNESQHIQLTPTSDSSQNEGFQQAKKQYLLDFTQYVEQNINTPEELSLVKKITQSIKQAIEALKKQPDLFPEQTNEPANKILFRNDYIKQEKE